MSHIARENTNPSSLAQSIGISPGWDEIVDVDGDIARAISDETQRERNTIELIASENYASPAVRAAQSTVLANKYAEGYPGRRYYGGCRFVDVAESLARKRAGDLFHADHANVQPHSGSQANAAAYMALLDIGDTVMAMDLAHGGHLTHGSRLSFSGRQYRFVHYGVSPDDERIDYDALAAQAKEVAPKLIVAGASAYSRIIDFGRLAQIAASVDACLMVDMAHIAGLVAAGVHPSPIPHADVVTTTTHKTLRGPRGGMIFCRKALARKVDRAVFPGTQGGPLMHVIAAKAVALHEAAQPGFRDYARRIVANAGVLAASLADEGLRIVAGGTDNHMFLVDVRSLGVTGMEAELALERAGIAVNHNMIPFDPNPPRVTSGIRIGTPAVTTRGMGPEQMHSIAGYIGRLLRNPGDDKIADEVASEARALCSEYPVPGL